MIACLRCALLGGAVVFAATADASGQCSGLGGSLIQGRDRVQKKVVHGTEEGCEDQPFIQLDGVTETVAEYTPISDGFVREVVLEYPLGSGVSVADGKATFNFGTALEARFSRSATNIDDHTEQQDYGAVKQLAFVSEKTGISDLVKFSLAEKSHTTYMPSGVNTATKTKMDYLKTLQDASALESAEAAAFNNNRVAAASAMALAGARQVLAASTDSAHVGQVRALAGGAVSDSLRQSMTEATETMAEHKNQQHGSVLRSSMSVIHFENADLMTFSASGVSVPLDTPIVAYRGRLASHPNKEYQLSTGLAVFSKTGENLHVYFGFSSVVDLQDSMEGIKAKFKIGTADGQAGDISTCGSRTAAHPMDACFQVLWSQVSRYQPDFGYLHKTREEAGCSNAVLAAVQATAAPCPDGTSEADQNALKCGVQGLLHRAMVSPLFGKIHDTRVQHAGSALVQTVNMMANCAVEIFTTVAADTNVMFDRPEALAMVHLLSVVPWHALSDTLADAATDKSFWNTITLT